jgi:hypothetical protein
VASASIAPAAYFLKVGFIVNMAYLVHSCRAD